LHLTPSSFHGTTTGRYGGDDNTKKGVLKKFTLNIKGWLFQEDANTTDMFSAAKMTQTMK
jgi:hypothetical protein